MTYRERRERRMEQRLEWAAGRRVKSEAAWKRSHDLAAQIPLGQPILVGHHSEKRARRDQERIQRGAEQWHESYKMAGRHAAAADGIAHQLDTSIYSDDEDARERLEERIADLEAERDRVKAFNATARKGAPDHALLDEKQRDDLVLTARVQAYALGKGGGFPAYHLTNLGGNIRRYRERLATLDRPPAPRFIEVRYAGTCADCGATIAKGATARYDKAERALYCAPACAQEGE
jgi:DNA repair exonuclease SbcCD ATPase subunit